MSKAGIFLCWSFLPVYRMNRNPKAENFRRSSPGGEPAVVRHTPFLIFRLNFPACVQSSQSDHAGLLAAAFFFHPATLVQFGKDCQKGL